MREVKVSASLEYSVLIDKGILSTVGDLCKKVVDSPIKMLVVTDEIVAKLYLKTVVESLQKAGYKTFSVILPSGETTKSIENFSKILSISAELNFNRQDCFVALGGGVIGDLVGFCASSFMRGIKYIQVPTTLLSAIDSSVGGKTAVNLPEGKNLVGAFWQPSLVVCDTETLKTLPRQQFLCGVGEAVKYAVLDGGRIYDIISKGEVESNYEELVELCVKSKAKIVRDDEKENGVRKLLNLGHTIGHAVEKLSQYTALHGICVAKGINLLAKAQYFQGSITKECFDKVQNLLNAFDFDLSIDYSESDLIKEFVHDKKCVSSGVSLVKIKDIGSCYVENVPLEKMGEAFKCK